MPARQYWLILSLILWLGFLVFGLIAQTHVRPSISPRVVESLPIAGGDLLHVAVFDVPELEQHARVSDSGYVTLALIGSIHIAGMTPSEAGQEIARAYQHGYIRKPQVNVLVDEYAVANVSITGQVLHPGNYPLSTPRDLMEVLSMAGGLTPLADIHVTVKHQGHTGTTVYAALPNDPDAALLNSVKVAPGDLVIVPKAGIVYVLGDVNRPGGYVMQNDAQLTALQAVALAAGLTKTSSENHARLVRQTVSGPVELPLPLNAMQRGKQPDLMLQPQDVVYVPYSTARNLMLGASAILSSASGAAIYAAH